MALSENAKKILTFLQTNDGNFTQNDIADATGLERKVMTGTVTGLVRKGFVVRVDDTYEFVDGEKTKKKAVKYVKLTDVGATTNPDSVE
jgi:DNA-binding MarR family transcriptional regulator